MEHRELSSVQLYKSCDVSGFAFETTAELNPIRDLSQGIGQPRAVQALKFGVGIDQHGYNIYALGPSGMGKHTFVRQYLSGQLQDAPTPADLCYVNNFDIPGKPRLLNLPPGWGGRLASDMDHLREEVPNVLKGAFESEEYQNRLQALQQEFKEYQQSVFEDLSKKAKERGLTLIRMPSGFGFAPVRDGEVVPPEEFQKLPEEEQKKIQNDIEEMQNESQRMFQKFPAWQRDMRQKISDLNDEVAGYAVGPLLDEIRDKYTEVSAVGEYLNAVQRDIVDNVRSILESDSQQEEGQAQQSGAGFGSGPGGGRGQAGSFGPMRRYKVNVLVDNSQSSGAPVIYEDNPTCANLVGRVEHQPMMGALITDFNLIKPGALHRANGGALILDAHKVLTQPGAWDGLKRALISQKIRIESLAEMFSLISTISLEPEPVPLKVKVVLVGNPLIYYILKEFDPEFGKLFKVAADFDFSMQWDREHQDLFARFMAGVAEQEGLMPLNRSGVARLLEYSARKAQDQTKLSTHVQGLTDMMREADFWARENSRESIAAQDVQQAIDASVYRSDLMRERVQESISRGVMLIDTQGWQAGQINGLSVVMLGDFMFGRPNRITARVRLGKGEVMDIEREAKLSGPIHSKGVLILSGFLGARYAADRPLSLSATLVFEQSYGGIEGDSASSAELYCLLSAIAGIPINQSLAVTGSVNQHGQVQAIGGVNEKIEGFFDICRERGLSGEQGVLIPASNVEHLMLRRDVRDAVEVGRFHIYQVQTIDQGIELLTGLEAGESDDAGGYPPGSVNGRVQRRLHELSEKREQFGTGKDQGGQP
ncbi:Lon protease family protein [Desulfovermiculus halophilus]|uniref:Lon protease family protein n=1 Tax=Desulfovermiculus halophilus TaxID=339722 RepID=UPI00048379A6|nr:AAA family ATPase [Desulfovermiculus halophilus]